MSVIGWYAHPRQVRYCKNGEPYIIFYVSMYSGGNSVNGYYPPYHQKCAAYGKELCDKLANILPQTTIQVDGYIRYAAKQVGRVATSEYYTLWAKQIHCPPIGYEDQETDDGDGSNDDDDDKVPF